MNQCTRQRYASLLPLAPILNFGVSKLGDIQNGAQLDNIGTGLLGREIVNLGIIGQ